MFKLIRTVVGVAMVMAVGSTVIAQEKEQGRGGATPVKIPELPKIGEGVSPETLEAVVNAQMPLSDTQIRALRAHLDKIRKATSERPGTEPKPVSTTLPVSLGPGSKPLVVRLTADTVSSVVFTDSTGAPWPISSTSVGNKKVFEVTDVSKKSVNVLSISPLEDYARGNMAVLLEGATAPILITLLTGQHEVDYRVDVAVQSRGPKAEKPLIDAGFGISIPAIMNDILDGVPPRNSKEIKLSSTEGERIARAWKVENTIMLRTKMKLMSPAAIKAINSVDGTMVYEIPSTPMVLLTMDGKVVEVNLQDI